MGDKKPRAPRSPLVADVEIFDQQSAPVFQAKTSDVSMGGCFLEMPNPLPVRAIVKLQLTYNDSSITLFGEVVRSDLGKGMGVRFRSVGPNETSTLKGWFFSLEREEWQSSLD